MKMNLKILILLFVTAPMHAFTPSGEAINPFNKYISPTEGVGLFTGDAAFGHPVFTIKLVDFCGNR